MQNSHVSGWNIPSSLVFSSKIDAKKVLILLKISALLNFTCIGFAN